MREMGRGHGRPMSAWCERDSVQNRGSPSPNAGAHKVRSAWCVPPWNGELSSNASPSAMSSNSSVIGRVVSSCASTWAGRASSTETRRWSWVRIPQDMSRAFLMTLERLAFMTVLVISRMIDSKRFESTASRTGSNPAPPAVAAVASTTVARLPRLRVEEPQLAPIGM